MQTRALIATVAAALASTPASQPQRKRGTPATRALAVATLVGALWVALSVGTAGAAEPTPQQHYAKALQYAITRDVQRPGYVIRTVVVRPYHTLTMGTGVRIAQFEVWVSYVYRGQSHVTYLVILPDGEVLDQAMVKGVGDTGGLLG
jgi:hypothetical protein